MPGDPGAPGTRSADRSRRRRSRSGVSTSSTPRAAKNVAHAREHRGALLQAQRGVGRQGASRSPRSRDAPEAWPTRTAVPARSAGASAHARAEQQDHGRAHVEAAELGAFGEQRYRGAGMRVIARRAAGVTSPAHTVAMLPTLSAPTSTSANCPKLASNSVSTRSLRANRRGTRRAVAAFTLNSAPARRPFEQAPAHRHVDAVIVEGREIDRRERAAREASRPRPGPPAAPSSV